jgi:hypothetical protein
MNSNKKSHEQNVANMEILTTRVSSFAKPFNPFETRLSITNQLKLKSDGETVIALVASAEHANDKAVVDRAEAFDNLDDLVTRLANEVRISSAPAQTIKQFESLVREFRNKRASASATSTESTATTESTETTGDQATKKQNSKHNSGMDAKIDLFTQMISFLKTATTYNTNEPDLKITALEAKLLSMKQTNSAFLVAEAAAIAARQQRQTILYADKVGLVPVGLDSKKQVKSAYGSLSPEYKSISGISFFTIKN